ncbi:hypothetical protein ASPACDRAFT_58664 [Aspergillus aculeatus ATCC 16872]|uniref:Uncharacterized protein n=1 Tax=Aspergillus aculeatus (strain ATCC 16872 / CBS 172.66 / WB 5094) TaxID=690307 RepID=A0A1L9X1T5_ASPA1|nr:uncharacterized protein ASPACDRAFT_58664 [Aspergillus aculeatus ATCC 16872]OJK02336.1 hypothetical protein ASPACDRAFT_58664 [Aspergillus aculeatus ATCC 16872]
METIARDYLSLRGLLALPWMQILEPELQAAIASRRQILIAAARDETNLSPVACSLVRVALATEPDHAPVSLDPQAQKQAKRLSQFAQYFARADYLSDQSSIAIKAAILEGSFYTTLLQSKRAACMFPMTESPEQDRYLQYIPVLITIPSTTSEGCYTPQWLFDLAQWSMYIFLVDEYMESVVVHFSTDELAQFCAGLELIHPYPDPGESIIGVPQLLSHQAGKQPLQNAAAAPNVQAALSVYYTWAREMLNWDRLSRCSATDMNELRSEIKKYLLFHAHQIQDNLRLADQLGRAPTQSNTEASVARFESPRTSFATWLHSVGAGHVSAPVSLAFLAAYMGSWVRNSTNGDDPHQRRDCWSSVMQRVLAHEMNQHVGAYCRLYNDYGSVQRDLREGNLNSVHFPEFWTHEIAAESERTGTDDCVARLKATLLQVGRHERRMAESLGDELYNSLEGEDNDQGSRIAGALRVYCRNAELFSDLYLTRDVTNSVK